MVRGKGPYKRDTFKSTFGENNTQLLYERKTKGFVIGVKSDGCPDSISGEISEDVLATFLKAQSILFEKMLPT